MNGGEGVDELQVEEEVYLWILGYQCRYLRGGGKRKRSAGESRSRAFASVVAAGPGSDCRGLNVRRDDFRGCAAAASQFVRRVRFPGASGMCAPREFLGSCSGSADRVRLARRPCVGLLVCIRMWLLYSARPWPAERALGLAIRRPMLRQCGKPKRIARLRLHRPWIICGYRRVVLLVSRSDHPSNSGYKSGEE